VGLSYFFLALLFAFFAGFFFAAFFRAAMCVSFALRRLSSPRPARWRPLASQSGGITDNPAPRLRSHSSRITRKVYCPRFACDSLESHVPRCESQHGATIYCDRSAPFASAWAVVMRWLEFPVLFLALVMMFVIFPLDDERGRDRL
jgi:hypothetical protein